MPLINMKKFYILSLALLLIVAITLIGCKKTDNTPVVTEIPLKVTELLQKSKDNLSLHSQKIQIVDFEYYQTISTESEKNSLVENLTNPKSSWYASGNILADSTVLVSALENFSNDSSAQATLKDHIEKCISVGTKVVKINWRLQGGTQFSTLCAIGDTSIVWDGLLTNLIMVEHNVPAFKNTSNVYNGSSYDNTYSDVWTAYWLWGSERGEMGYTMTIHCSSNTNVTSTDFSTWSWITGGSAESHCQVIQNSGAYGQVQYALGMATPLAFVSFDIYNFTVTLSGIGSNIIENGTHSLYP